MEAFLRKYALRIAITAMFVVIAWTIREGLRPMPLSQHLLGSIPVIIITQSSGRCSPSSTACSIRYSLSPKAM
ncbi:hypothetical protein [Chitinophaga deserti]|uniref:hypothetical protein n=1 Tax=Chitinophaga deserti TaxID=2164099 RepID=UPI0013004170|nr:hypothetical protein [Chitinophaga deserti]